MRNRIFNLLTLCSGLIAGCICLAGVCAEYMHPQRHQLTLASDFHISLSNGRLHFFSNGTYGPYRGSIIAIAESPDLPVKTGLTLPFLCYRHFRWRQGHVMWTLSISLLGLLIPFAILPAIRFVLWLNRREPAMRTARPANA